MAQESTQEPTPTGKHLIDGEFQSDKYPWCQLGFVPLKLTDEMAQPLLWQYAETRRDVDKDFADDLQAALRLEGYDPDACWLCGGREGPFISIWTGRVTPGGEKCRPMRVKVHNGCYMDMDA